MLSRDFPILSINLQNKHRKQNNKNKMKDFEVKFSDCKMHLYSAAKKGTENLIGRKLSKIVSISKYKLPQRKFQFSVPDGDVTVLYIHNIKDGKEKSGKK